MRKWLFLLLALFLALPTWWVIAQDGPTIEITGANANDLPIITINTSVLDSSNRPILGLTPADFTLGGDLEGLATIINVENVTDDSLPFAVVLVIDTSTSMSGLPLQQAQEAARLFVLAIGGNDPVAIVSFDSDARLVQDYTTDKELLLAAIDGLFVRGRTALYDAAVLGVEVANAAPVPRRAVILLSDGAEYGGESVNGRAVGLDTALELGVPVYTVGLGYGIDRSYLQELADGTNARNYESPDPEQLSGIYAELAALFRTQYVITLDSTIAGDGTEYAFTLQANTPNGASNIAEGTVRAPIPVPIISFAEGTFDEPFSSLTSISPIIAADQEIVGITATIDGADVEVVNGVIAIDPAQLPPATYTLVMTATDADGDIGTVEASFETAPLPPSVSISGLPEGEIIDVVTVSLDIESQTAISSVTYSAGDIASDSTDSANGFPFTLDPVLFPAGDYELTVDVSNEGGASTTVTTPFSVGEVAPRNIRIDGLEGEISEVTELTIAADAQAGAEISSISITANGETLEGTTIDPLDYPAGELVIEVTATDSNGRNATSGIPVTIAAVAPRLTISEIPSPIVAQETVEIVIESQGTTTATYSIDDGEEVELVGSEIVIDGNALGNGEHSLVITVTDENGMTSSASAEFTVELPPTATPTPNVSETAQAELNIQSTADSLATAVPQTEAAETDAAETAAARQETLDANASQVFEAEATRNAQSTLDAAPTSEEIVTDEAVAPTEEEATVEAAGATEEEATATDEEEATEIAVVPTDEPTVIPTDEASEETEAAIAATDATDEPTLAPSSTATLTETQPPTSGATLTPIGEIIEVDAQSAPPVEGNLTTLLLICGGGVLLVILLAIVFFGRRRRGEPK